MPITKEDVEDDELLLKKMMVNALVGVFCLIILGMSFGFIGNIVDKVFFPEKRFIQMCNEMEEMFFDIGLNKQKIKDLDAKIPSKWSQTYGKDDTPKIAEYDE